MRCIGIHGRNRYRAVILDIDDAAGFFGQPANHGAALADHVTNLFRIDLDVDHARREVGNFFTMTGHGALHLFQDMQTCFLGLGQRDLHDFLGDALDLDVHLQSRDAFFGTRHLEVHVAQMILVAEDVGQHRKAGAVLDQAHGDARHMRLERHAGIHQGQ